MSKIYTGTGDKGTTSLFTGKRVPKNHLRIHVYGTLDEVNALVGVARTLNRNLYLEQLCSRLQTLLFILSSDLATPVDGEDENSSLDRVSQKHVKYIEKCIDDVTRELSPLKNFILPGGTTTSALLQLARTVCRRAERLLVALSGEETVSVDILALVNRLSDYLFVLARYANKTAGVPDEVLNRNFPEINNI